MAQCPHRCCISSTGPNTLPAATSHCLLAVTARGTDLNSAAQLSQCPDTAWPTSRLYSAAVEMPLLLALIIFVSTCAWIPRKLLWCRWPCAGRGDGAVFVWENEKEDRRNGTMKTLSHWETGAASGDTTDRRSQERPGKRKELWQPWAQRRPTESLTLSACCLTQWKRH